MYENNDTKAITFDVIEIMDYVNKYIKQKNFSDFAAKLDTGLFLDTYRRFVKIHPGWETHVFTFISEVIHDIKVPFKTRVVEGDGRWSSMTRAQQWAVIMATLHGTGYDFLTNRGVVSLINLGIYNANLTGNELASHMLHNVIKVNYFKERLHRCIIEQILNAEIFNDWYPVSETWDVCMTKHSYLRSRATGKRVAISKALPADVVGVIGEALSETIPEVTSTVTLPTTLYRVLVAKINEHIDSIIDHIKDIEQ